MKARTLQSRSARHVPRAAPETSWPCRSASNALLTPRLPHQRRPRRVLAGRVRAVLKPCVTSAVGSAALCLLLGGGVRATAAAGPGTIEVSVDTSKTGAKIDRNSSASSPSTSGPGIYEGVWVGPDSPIPNTRGIRNDVVAALKALKVPNVRWPGGCFADEYHWRKGIGPRARRVAQPELGRRARAEHLRHARVHGLREPDRRRGLSSRSTSDRARRRKRPSGSST